MSFEKLKEKWLEILIFAILSLLVLLWESIVDKFIVPRVQEHLVTEKYLRQEIKDGKFVVTDKQSFVENHPIGSERLIELNDGSFLSQSHADKSLEKYISELAKLEAKVSSYQDRVINQNSQIDDYHQTNLELQRRIDSLEALAEALAKDTIEVKLYISDKPGDKGYIVLNENNLAISSIVINGDDYYVKSGSGKRYLEARLESLSAPEDSKESAIGRVHRSDYHKIFNGQNGKLGIAFVAID